MLTLISNSTSEYVIIRGAIASPSEITAANELQDYLKQISGVEIPIRTDTEPEKEHEIIIGKTNRETDGELDRNELGDDGFVIKTSGEKLWLVGGEQRGTLYSVYEFLEKYIGCRFFTETLEIVPQKETVAICTIECDKQIPVFEFRDSFWFEYFHENISVKRKLNSYSHRISKEKGGMLLYAGGNSHTNLSLVEPDLYFNEHPEYFRMDTDGVRKPQDLCLTNPEVLEIAKRSVRKQLDAQPDAKIVSVTQMDMHAPCLCPECMKVYAEEGGAYSGTYIRFVNEIAKDIQYDYPGVKVDTFAYRYTRSMPKKTKPADNVIVRLCTIECCFSHPLKDNCKSVSDIVSYTDGSSNSFIKDMTDWASVCNTIYVWDYTTNFRNYSGTFPNFGVLRENAKFFADNHVVGLFEQGAYQDESAEFGELRAYLLAKLLWNPYMSDEEYYTHMDEFLRHYYGPGWKYIREYIELCEKESDSKHFDIGTEPFDIFERKLIEDHKRPLPDDFTFDKISDYCNTDWSKYFFWFKTNELSVPAATGGMLFEHALSEAETDLQRFHIERSSIQVIYQCSYEKHENMKLIKDNIRELVDKYFRCHPDAAGLKQQIVLRSACAIAALHQAEKEYIDSNYVLYETLRKYNISRTNEFHAYINVIPNLENLPIDWDKY